MWFGQMTHVLHPDLASKISPIVFHVPISLCLPSLPFPPSLLVWLTRCRGFSERLQGSEALGHRKTSRRKESGTWITVVHNIPSQTLIFTGQCHEWELHVYLLSHWEGIFHCSYHHDLPWLIQRPLNYVLVIETWTVWFLTESRARKWRLQLCIYLHMYTKSHIQFIKHFPYARHQINSKPSI